MSARITAVYYDPKSKAIRLLSETSEAAGYIDTQDLAELVQASLLRAVREMYGDALVAKARTGEMSKQPVTIVGQEVTAEQITGSGESEDEARPVATQYEVDRHAEKQDRSYADAWRYFESQGYDMSEVDPQY